MTDREAARGRLIHRIELRASDYLVGEIGPSKWIRWGRLMGLIEAGAIHGYWSAQMVQGACASARAGSRGRASVSLLSADHRDADIVEAASSGGWQPVIELPGMLLGERPARPDPRPGVLLDWVDPAQELSTFREVLQDGFADEEDERQMIAAVFAEPASLAPPGIRAIIASVEGTPASCGVAYETEGLGVIGWVATLPAFRRRGLGTLVTAAAVDALFDAGATGVILQASPDGLPVYARMGFREVTRYRIWLPPEAASLA